MADDKKKKPGCCFDEIKKIMRTYDLLLFRGTDIVSTVIAKLEQRADGPKVAEEADFTHVGLVIRGDDLLPAKDPAEEKWLHAGEVYVLESTMSGDLADGCHDVHGESHLGVQLRVLSDVVQHYDKPEKSRMAWCSLRVPLPKVASETVRAEFEKYRGVSYDMSVIDLAACVFPPMRKIRDNKAFEHIRDALIRFFFGSKRADSAGYDNLASKWQFCSEMAANVYKDIGLLPPEAVADNTMPADFVTDPEDPTRTLDSDKEIPPLFTKPVRFHA